MLAALLPLGTLGLAAGALWLCGRERSEPDSRGIALVALPVYAVGESPIEGVSSDALVAGLRDRGHRHASTVADATALAANVAGGLKAGSLRGGDMIICLGAGDITKIAAGLASAVEGQK